MMQRWLQIWMEFSSFIQVVNFAKTGTKETLLLKFSAIKIFL